MMVGPASNRWDGGDIRRKMDAREVDIREKMSMS
jgi:hypothetical protein